MPHAHLLVVDDEPSILTTLQKALTLEGYSVDVAGGVKVADEKLKKRSYDLCLFDVQLPDGDGITLLSQIRAAKNEVPVIMMSGHATIDTAVKATRLGAMSFLEKPINTDALLIAVETALRLQRAESEARELRAASGSTGELVGESQPIKKLVEQISRAAKSSASVLVTGERGTGKELVARAIHLLSPRAKGPLEKLNCAALPSELIESELFGHEVGAFTGATKQRRGKFERASGGTLFLDEVGDMPLDLQGRLLRVLEERRLASFGSDHSQGADVAVIAATHRNLREMIAAGRFREDLYYRLSGFVLTMPALRHRRDLAALANALLHNHCAEPVPVLSPEVVRLFEPFPWPGNVRQLANVLRSAVAMAAGAGEIRREHLADDFLEEATARAGSATGASDESLQRQTLESRGIEVVRQAVAAAGGNISAASKALGISRNTVYRKLRGAEPQH